MKRQQILTIAAVSLISVTNAFPALAANHFEAAQFRAPAAQQQFHMPAAQQQFHMPAAQQQFHMPAAQQQFRMPVAQQQQFRMPATQQQQFRMPAAQQQFRGRDAISTQPIRNFNNSFNNVAANNVRALDRHDREFRNDRHFGGAPVVYNSGALYNGGVYSAAPIYNGGIVPTVYDTSYNYGDEGYGYGVSNTSDIDAQKTALAQQIQAASMSRQISGGAATNLAMMLNQLNADEDNAIAADGGGLNPGDRANILGELNNIGNVFSQAVAYNG